MNNFILIGFDRSGTSAISRTLASHPQVELIFRPFNSGPIRKKMYKILDKTNVTNNDINFFSKLQNQKLDSTYFKSKWHLKYSTVQENFKEGFLHVIISNINHFSVKWIKNSFPQIEQWGIWRDPLNILNSCYKNGFYGEWYTDALTEIVDSVCKEEELNKFFGKYVETVEKSNYVIKTAFLIAVRNYFLFRNIDSKKVVDYELFKNDPNVALEPIINHFGLSSNFDFSEMRNVDLNSIPSIDGYSKDKKSNLIISGKDRAQAEEMFEPLYRIYTSKHCNYDKIS